MTSHRDSRPKIHCMLPSVVLEECLTYISHYSIPENLLLSTKTLISHTLPPPNCNHISSAAKYILSINHSWSKLNVKQLNSIICFWDNISKNNSSGTPAIQLGTEYPLFFSLRKFSDFKKSHICNNIILSNCFELYLDLCQSALSDHIITPSVYYSHILSVRDCLTTGISYMRNISESLNDPDDFISVVTKHSKLAISLLKCSSDINDKNYLAKFERLYNLLTKKWVFGQPERLIFNKNKGSVDLPSNDNDKSNPHTIADPQFVSDCTLDIDKDINDGSLITLITVQDENSNSSETAIVRDDSPKGSRKTRCDDRQLVHNRINAMSAKNVVALSDPQRLPLATVIKFLSHLASINISLCHFAWLFVSYGFNPKRFERLTHYDISNEQKNDEIRINRFSSTIRSHIRNGATDFLGKINGFPSNFSFIELGIPLPITKIICDLIDNDQLKDYLQSIDVEASKFTKFCFGPTPTLERLSASFSTLIEPQFPDKIESNTATGSIPTKYRAQVNYYTLDNPTIYLNLRKAVTQLNHKISKSMHCCEKLASIISSYDYPDININQLVGSQVAKPINDLQILFNAIEQQHKEARKEARLSRPDKRLYLARTLIQLQHMQLYLCEQISYALRPIGKIASISTSGVRYGACIQDKGSSLYNERGISPHTKKLQSLIDHARIELDAFIHYLNAKGSSILINEDFFSTNIPIVFIASNNSSRKYQFKRMTGSAFQKLLDQRGLIGYFPGENNAIRHSIASHLRNILPDSIRDEFMRHEREGMDFCSPFSTSNGESYQLANAALEKVFNTLKINNLTQSDCL